MRRILVAVVLVMAGAGLFPATSLAATPITTPHLPPPPHVVGCYRMTNTVWHKVACETAAFKKAHVPHPEVLSGIAEGFTTKNSHFAVSVISVKALNRQGGTETDTKAGAGAYSLQDNEVFTGSNGQVDGVQFTDQVNPALAIFGLVNNVCVWQVDITTQNYTSTCAYPLGNVMVQDVEGTAWGGLLTVAAAVGSTTAVAVVVADIYGLGKGNRWNNSSGSILGYGNSSEAVFSKVQAAIGIEVSTCVNDAGFIQWAVFCVSPVQKVKPLTYVSYSPGPSTLGKKTGESNNLIPVIGSPPAKLPPLLYFGAYTAQIFYTATTTGKCLTGTPPTCL